MNTIENLSSLAATMVYLLMPIVIMFGLVFTTKFAFKSTITDPEKSSKEDFKFEPLSTDKKSYSVVLEEMQMLAVQISTILTWVLVVLSVLSWLGKAFGFWCFP